MTSTQTIEPQILESYNIVKKLGSGAYGHVWKVVDKTQKKTYALKKIFQAFQNATDAQRTFRQISILKKIQHKNIIELHEYMETDLYRAIYENILEDIHRKYIIYQLLVGTKYLHEMGLIHRDLKPSNVLLDSSCSAKICDFGLARLVKFYDKESNVMTEGVATRWYRAPEVLLGSSSYGYEADLWSIGCIIAQFLIKNPMFPGSSTINQLEKILQFTGRPNIEDTTSIDCEYAEQFIEQCGNIKKKSAKQFFGASADPLLVDLVYKLLQFNPSKRLPLENLLQHSYFAQVYNQRDLDFGIRKKIQLEVNENIKLTTDQYKELILNFESKQRIFKTQRTTIGEFSNQRAESVKRDRSPIRAENRSPIHLDKNDMNRSRISQVSPSSKSPQRFRQIKKAGESSFGKLLGSEKVKKRSDSRDSSSLVSTQQEKRGCQLFSELIKNKDSKRNGSKLRSNLNDKENIHSNNSSTHLSSLPLKSATGTVNVTQCLKKFECPSNTSRISFQGLKKTTKLKFNR